MKFEQSGTGAKTFTYNGYDGSDASTFAPGPRNQISDIDDGSPPVYPNWDDNGCLTYNGEFTFTWTPDNHLESIEKNDKTLSMAFVYDDQGRRINKKVYTGSGNGSYTLQTNTYYIYDGWSVIEEITSDGSTDTVVAEYLNGRDLDEPIAAWIDGVNSGNPIYFHQNPLGNVEFITDVTGTVIERYQYDIHGNVTVLDANGNITSTNPDQAQSPYLFTARRWEKGLKLYYFRNRYYSPALGRFISPDPLDYVDGMNVYAYVNGNTVNLVDPMGLESSNWQPWSLAKKLTTGDAYASNELYQHAISYKYENEGLFSSHASGLAMVGCLNWIYEFGATAKDGIWSAYSMKHKGRIAIMYSGIEQEGGGVKGFCKASYNGVKQTVQAVKEGDAVACGELGMNIYVAGKATYGGGKLTYSTIRGGFTILGKSSSASQFLRLSGNALKTQAKAALTYEGIGIGRVHPKLWMPKSAFANKFASYYNNPKLNPTLFGTRTPMPITGDGFVMLTGNTGEISGSTLGLTQSETLIRFNFSPEYLPEGYIVEVKFNPNPKLLCQRYPKRIYRAIKKNSPHDVSAGEKITPNGYDKPTAITDPCEASFGSNGVGSKFTFWSEDIKAAVEICESYGVLPENIRILVITRKGLQKMNPHNITNIKPIHEANLKKITTTEDPYLRAWGLVEEKEWVLRNKVTVDETLSKDTASKILNNPN